MANLLQALPYVEMVLAALLVVGVLLQRSEAGLGSAFGDYEMGGRLTRRGLEKIIFNSTIVVALLFILSVLANFAL